MSDIYFHEHLMIIPIDGISREKILKPIKRDRPEWSLSEEIWRQEYTEVLRGLAERVPLVFDGNELPISQDRKLWAGFRYVSPQKIGRADCHINAHEDLGFALAHHRYGRFGSENFPLAHQLANQSGVVVEGNYHFGTEPQNMGAHYGEEFNGLRETLNLLYRGFTELTAQSLAEVQKLIIIRGGISKLPGIVQYWDHRTFTGEPSSHSMKFPLRNLSRAGIEQADQHLGEFAAWLQQEEIKEKIISTATSLSYALRNYDVATKLGARVDIFQGLPAQAHSIGNSWLEEAAEKFRQLQPPENERMKIVLQN